MIGALLTALFYGITPVCANRAIRLLGFVRANLGRLLIACVAMGAWAFTFGRGLSGEVLLFATAGAIGFGIGGTAMFLALPRLGAPLASLVDQSVAAAAAAVLAWVWFSDPLGGSAIACGLVVFAGVVIGLLPYVRGTTRRSGAELGVLLALVAGVAEATSSTLSRRALLLMHQAGTPVDLPTAAFQRLAGGCAVVLVIFVLARWAWRRRWGFAGDDGRQLPVVERHAATPVTAQPLYWVGLNALFGPILGVTCMVWALQTLQPGIAQTVAAAAPLISVPFARWIEGHRPPARYYVGAVVAIVGLGALYLTTG
jgi:drug/metabolite transporter (DMT)-like permease